MFRIFVAVATPAPFLNLWPNSINIPSTAAITAMISALSKYPLSYYTKILEKLEKNNIKNILLISGFHHKANHLKSIEYIDRIKRFFEDNNYKVEKRINNDPDDDFIIMCNSKYFTFCLILAASNYHSIFVL